MGDYAPMVGILHVFITFTGTGYASAYIKPKNTTCKGNNLRVVRTELRVVVSASFILPPGFESTVTEEIYRFIG